MSHVRAVPLPLEHVGGVEGILIGPRLSDSFADARARIADVEATLLAVGIALRSPELATDVTMPLVSNSNTCITD